MTFFRSIKDSLAKTRDGLFDRITHAIAGKALFSSSDLLQLEEQLLLADVGVAAAERLLSALRRNKEGLPAAEALRREMLEILSSNSKFKTCPEQSRRIQNSEFGGRPEVWLIAGVNGSGKTTSIGKLGHRLKAQGKQIMLAAADTYRAAAIEQLQIWAQRIGADFVGSRPGADPASVAYDAVSAAISRDMDFLLIDTAGRLHDKKHLRDELTKIYNTIGKRMPGAPHQTMLVLDATTGQNALSQAKLFSEAIRIDGIILTKLDGTAKGGIVLAIAQELAIPVAFVGTGEGVDDLRPFDAAEFVEGIFS
ncbi:MAG: signal recognition particle-docking protein FtsY [Candidatus Edwardsbacteria bacterium]|nr:signal recognition particle-docking protein FtsY [Candidatus Edwardsbacteria bacterium]